MRGVRWWQWTVAAAWVGLLLTGSLADGGTKASLGTQGEYHRVWHVAAFAATVVVVGWCLAPLAGFLLRVTCELLQRVIYIPVVEWEDVGDDALGAAVGWLVLTVWRRWRAGQPEVIAH